MSQPRRRPNRGRGGGRGRGSGGPWLKPGVFTLCSLPLLVLGGQALLLGPFQALGANPVETLTHFSGDWALRLLLVTLAMTPLRQLTGQPWPILIRRMLGLFAFFYAGLHFTVWLVFDHGLDPVAMLEDIAERPYVTLGFSAFVLLIPLAVTSTNGWMRRLGRNWQRLHRLVYPAALLAVLHFVWLVKGDQLEPLVYGALLALLLGWRVQRRWLPAAAGRRAG